MKKLLLLTSDSALADSVKTKLTDTEVTVSEDADIITNNFDLVAITDGIRINNITDNDMAIIRLHNSLLPSFNTYEPVKDAYLSGVKVTGVTVNKVENSDMTGLILAQYPVLIDTYTSYGQLET